MFISAHKHVSSGPDPAIRMVSKPRPKGITNGISGSWFERAKSNPMIWCDYFRTQERSATDERK